tara:strand:- start:7091 stop:8632 length:1542 start_codon:yes stop_codon:yes gene_type:complete
MKKYDSEILSFYLKKILSSRVYEIAKESPLEYAPLMSQKLKAKIYLKREDQQETFSFKIRGAYNKIANLTEMQLERGIICASAGNHAQGVSLAAKKLGTKATIVMPKTTPEVKVEAVKKLGAFIILVGDSYSEAYEKAWEISLKKKLTFIHPFDDDEVIAGQGTIGMEILRQSPRKLKAIFVAIGGGGLIAGVGAYIKALRPAVKIVGVQMEDSDAMKRSLAAGKRIILKKVGLFSDGTAVKQVGVKTFKLSKHVVDEIVTVGVDEVCAAIKDIFEDTRTIQEPAGALALAGLKKYKSSNTSVEPEDSLIAITCGANINFDRLRVIAERSELGEDREAILGVSLPEKRGSFLKFCKLLGNRHVTEFNYRISSTNEAIVFVSIGIKNDYEKNRAVKAIESGNFKVYDLSADEISKSHIRHMIGGYSPLAANEKLFKFEFPERPGALMEFLSSMKSTWNISLFNYRNNGSDTGRILIGLQIPKSEEKEFKMFLKRTNYAFKNESDNIAYKLFLNS